jgi:hypothetical protein
MMNAMPGSHVHQQIGVNHGTVNQYVIDPDASPEEKYRKGRWFLDGGMREQAEQLISEAVANHHVSPEILYYWSLSILSRRAVEDIRADDMAKLDTFDRLLHRLPRDRFSQAADAVVMLLKEALGRPQRQGPDDFEARRTEAITAAIGQLPPQQRSEIQTHLRSIISGVERDRLDALEGEEIRTHRMAGKREQRVPLFFHPDPLPPVMVPAAAGRPPAARVAALVLGTAVLAFGVLLAGGPLFADDAGPAVGGLLLCVLGAVLTVRCGTERAWLTRRARDAELWHTAGGPATRRSEPENAASPARTSTAAENEFTATIDAIILLRFREQPQEGEDAGEWWRATTALRANLSTEIFDLYGGSANPWALDWLVQFHARRTAERWRAGRLAEYRSVLRVRALTYAGLAAGYAVLILGLLVAGNTAGRQSAGRTAMAALLLAVGAIAAVRGGYPLYVRKRGREADRQEFTARYDEELETYWTWQRFLWDNRPADAEMARWLDYDQRHLRRESFGDYRVKNQDVIFDFFILEGTDDCLRAKVRNGPPRYSEYRVRLYVMTAGGIRQGEWVMDFATGKHSGRSDSAFRYDAISQVRVARIGVMLGEADQGIVAMQSDGSLRGTPRTNELMLGEALELTLNNGQQTRVMVENFSKLYERDIEDLTQLRRLAMETSGISTAFRILVAVAAEGRDWFAQQRLRSSQEFMEFRERAAGIPPALPQNVHRLPPAEPPGAKAPEDPRTAGGG